MKIPLKRQKNPKSIMRTSSFLEMSVLFKAKEFNILFFTSNFKVLNSVLIDLNITGLYIYMWSLFPLK